MKITNIYTFLLFQIITFIVGTLIFISLFHTPLFENMHVFFYRGIILLIVSCLLMIGLLIFLKKSRLGALFTYKDIILAFICLFCFNLVFFTHVPVTADRSITIFILEYLNNQNETRIKPEEINDVFIRSFLGDRKAIEKRMIEQVTTGTVVSEENGYKITFRGQLLLRFYEFIRKLFGINK